MIIHGGIPKAASTFLQQVVFPALQTHTYVPDLMSPLNALGNHHLTQLPKDVLEPLSAIEPARSVVSCESFFGSYHHYRGAVMHSPELALTNLQALCRDDIQLLYVVRNQADTIDSMVRYKRRFLTDPDMLVADFPVKPNFFSEYRLKSQYGRLLRSYDYYSSLSLARNILGPERVHVLVYEDLLTAPELFFNKLSTLFEEDLSGLVSAAGEKVNADSLKEKNLTDDYVPMWPIIRKLNNLSGHRLEKVLPSRKTAVSEGRRRDYQKVFGERNRLLSDLFGLNLERYSYF